jgi:hypothetical protein
MEKRLLLGYHTHSGDRVFALIKRKMTLWLSRGYAPYRNPVSLCYIFGDEYPDCFSPRRRTLAVWRANYMSPQSLAFIRI